MAKKTTCYRSDAGNDFPTEHEALKDDLRHFILSVIKNEASAKELTNAMVEALEPEYGPEPPNAGRGYVPEMIWPGMASLFGRLLVTRPELPIHDPSRPHGAGEHAAVMQAIGR